MPTLKTPFTAIPALAMLPALLACSPLGPNSEAALLNAQSRDQAAVRCQGISRVVADRLRITETQWIDADRVRALDPAIGQDVGPTLPAHCLVRGRLDERIGSDGERYHIGFELRLPQAGNGRLLAQGGEGTEGVLPMAVGRNTGARGWADNGLLRGFAAVSTDGGHTSATPLFGLDPQAREDHAWRAQWRTVTTARRLFEHFYGEPPRHSYFIGCGTGGRHGMMFTQRFPTLFDGVIAQSPSMRASHGALIAAAWTVQQLARMAGPDAHGRTPPSAPLDPAQLQRVAAEVLDRCDAADGLTDGIVADTALCRIDPRRLACPSAGPGCLQPAQVQGLARIMTGPVNADGGRLYFGWPWDPGIGHPGWRAWTLGHGGPGGSAAGVLALSGALGFIHVTPPDATLTLENFDFDRDPLRLLPAHRLFDTADDVMLTPFQRRGGKLMLVHGMADPVNSAFDTVDYQTRVDRAHGAPIAARFVRTFLVPGMLHCAGGPSTDAFDGLSGLVAWVEHGQAPERLMATGTQDRPGLVRPLCAHPRIARYTGGDPMLADSFVCR
jgi:hypothetical protein